MAARASAREIRAGARMGPPQHHRRDVDARDDPTGREGLLEPRLVMAGANAHVQHALAGGKVEQLVGAYLSAALVALGRVVARAQPVVETLGVGCGYESIVHTPVTTGGA